MMLIIFYSISSFLYEFSEDKCTKVAVKYAKGAVHHYYILLLAILIDSGF